MAWLCCSSNKVGDQFHGSSRIQSDAEDLFKKKIKKYIEDILSNKPVWLDSIWRMQYTKREGFIAAKINYIINRYFSLVAAEIKKIDSEEKLKEFKDKLLNKDCKHNQLSLDIKCKSKEAIGEEILAFFHRRLISDIGEEADLSYVAIFNLLSFFTSAVDREGLCEKFSGFSDQKLDSMYKKCRWEVIIRREVDSFLKSIHYSYEYRLLLQLFKDDESALRNYMVTSIKGHSQYDVICNSTTRDFAKLLQPYIKHSIETMPGASGYKADIMLNLLNSDLELFKNVIKVFRNVVVVIDIDQAIIDFADDPLLRLISKEMMNNIQTVMAQACDIREKQLCVVDNKIVRTQSGEYMYKPKNPNECFIFAMNLFFSIVCSLPYSGSGFWGISHSDKRLLLREFLEQNPKVISLINAVMKTITEFKPQGLNQHP